MRVRIVQDVDCTYYRLRLFPIMFIALMASLFIFSPVAHADDCDDWFHRAKIKVSDKECEKMCSILETDMGTFMCPQRCHDFCQRDKCSNRPNPKIKDIRPNRWPVKSEKSKKWTSSEKVMVSKILATFPENLLTSLTGLYRFNNSETDGNSATTFQHQIAVYDSAFSETPNLNRVLAHELAHTLFDEYTNSAKQDYSRAADWTVDPFTKIVTLNRDFVTRPNSRVSIDEDFADNISEYIIHPDNLKLNLNKIYVWIRQKYGSGFNIKDCNE